jgi:trans-aconitate 2-methyltransferase
MAADWDPQQYGRFAEQRAQPFWDLLALVEPGRFERGVDLGCGTGELTAEAAGRLGVATMLGVDNSPAMLQRAATLARPGLEFVEGDIAGWASPGDHDLVLANASLQWVGDHPTVLARWVAALRPGGQIAVQVPSNADHHSHLASSAVARRRPFLSAFGAAGPPPDPVAANVLAPEAYSELLFDLGITAPHVRLQVYPHVMPNPAGVVEWTKGTSLTRFFKMLPIELHEPFVDAYRAELLGRIGDRAPYFYAFKRILMWGVLRGGGRAGSS